MQNPLSPKQIEFIENSTAHWNLAHGAVSTGKTVGTLIAFMHAVNCCPDSQIFMVGHSSDTIYQNAIRILLESEELSIFRPFCSWLAGRRQLRFKDKVIQTLGAKDEGAIGKFQGLTASLMYCDEMTLYPESIIDMIDTRLRKEHSKGFAAMNPSHPNHKCKQWIDKAAAGDPNYYALHFELDDNPFIGQDYKERVRNSASGLFYKRNVLGLWVMAEGAIFDFFDKKIHVVKKPPAAADYWIASIDFGSSNPFCCLLIGVHTGQYSQMGKQMWVEKEYYWEHTKRRPKVNSELADDVIAFLEPYAIKNIYIDPSAEAFQQELQRRGRHVTHANNDVFNGIQYMTNSVRNGSCVICSECTNLIKEIEGYVWDPSEAKKGYDEPLKKDDHACFVKDTLIDGKPIQNYEKGDEIYTRFGKRKILEKISRFSFCFEYEIAGRKISCTPDHLFFTVQNGWKKAENLIQSDILITRKECKKWENWEKPLSSNSKEKNIDDIQMLQMNLRKPILNAEEDISIVICGNKPMDQYPRDTIFITSTETPLIMIYPISNAFLPSNIQNDIQMILKEAFQTNAGKLLLIGIDLRLGGIGTNNKLLNTNLEFSPHRNIFVCNAELALQVPSNLSSNFVQISVNLNGEEKLELIMSLETVRLVANNFKLINLRKENTALDHVPKKELGKKKVYNLQIDQDEEYFSENILVHNCDALRYAIASHKIVAQYQGSGHSSSNYMQNRFSPTSIFK